MYINSVQMRGVKEVTKVYLYSYMGINRWWERRGIPPPPVKIKLTCLRTFFLKMLPMSAHLYSIKIRRRCDVILNSFVSRMFC